MVGDVRKRADDVVGQMLFLETGEIRVEGQRRCESMSVLGSNRVYEGQKAKRNNCGLLGRKYGVAVTTLAC